MRSSRWYQNCLQIVARLATIFLFLSGSFLKFDEAEISISMIFLGFNLLSGYFTSQLKYRRIQVIVIEVEAGLKKDLKHSKYYQRWLQLCGRGKDAFVFFLGLLLGKGYFTLSLTLLLIQLINGYLMSELVYAREQSVIREKTKTL